MGHGCWTLTVDGWLRGVGEGNIATTASKRAASGHWCALACVYCILTASLAACMVEPRRPAVEERRTHTEREGEAPGAWGLGVVFHLQVVHCHCGYPISISISVSIDP